MDMWVVDALTDATCKRCEETKKRRGKKHIMENWLFIQTTHIVGRNCIYHWGEISGK